MMRRQSGFSMAEILIAMGLMGVLATLLIPKIMTETGAHSFNAVARDTLALISEATFNCNNDETVTAGASYCNAVTLNTYFRQRLNYLREPVPNTYLMPSNGIIGPIADVADADPSTAGNDPGVRIDLDLPVPGGTTRVQGQVLISSQNERVTVVDANPAVCTDLERLNSQCQ